MRNGRIAEFLLALVTDRERARSIVGDLLEDTGAPFWDAVAGTGFSLLWRGMLVRPGRTLILAVLLWAPYSFLSVFFTLVANLVYGVLTGHTGLELIANRIPTPDHWMGPLVWYAAMPFVMGRCIGFVCEGRELAAAAVAAIVWPLLAMTSKVPLPDSPAVQLCLLAGAAQVRAARGNLWHAAPYTHS